MKFKRLSYDQICAIAEQKGGKFLSKTYSGVFKVYEWKCSNNHKWETRASNILHFGTWCPTCARNLTEEKCRYIFEKLTGKFWPSCRPFDENLELDGYCQELQMAFEYNGEQHYIKNHPFRKARESFTQQQKRDKRKIELAHESGIDIIVIHYKYKSKLEDFIKQMLSNRGLDVNMEIKWNEFNHSQSKINKLKQIADNHNGKLLSHSYNGAYTKYQWQCMKNHIWEASPYEAKNRWCSACNMIKRKEEKKKRRKEEKKKRRKEEKKKRRKEEKKKRRICSRMYKFV